MNGETNDNNQNSFDGIVENQGQTLEGNIENAFSDLISEFFEGGDTTQNAGNIEQGQVLDWDSVANGQLYTNINETANSIDNGINDGGTITENAGIYGNNNDGTITENTILYNNLETIGGEIGEQGTPYTGTNDGTGEENTGVYKTFNINGENEQTIAKNAYGVVTINSELLNGIGDVGTTGGTSTENTTTNQATTTTADGTDFKLTQGNLPAKISFWTKVRNFFISDSKLQYSVDQSTVNNGGVWNKIQNLFTFGKNK